MLRTFENFENRSIIISRRLNYIYNQQPYQKNQNFLNAVAKS